jgi:hypothetical protein
MSQAADKSYEPTQKFLEKVTDVVWHELLLKKVVLPSEEAATRAKIAKSVLQLAGTGVTDPGRLKLYALRLVEGEKRPRARAKLHLPD